MLLIYLNSLEWGGCDVLVERFARYLDGINVTYAIVDYKNSRLRRMLPDTQFYTDDELEGIAKDVKYLFFPSITVFTRLDVDYKLFGNAKIFSYVVHPNDAFRNFYPATGVTMNRLGYAVVRIWQTIFFRKTRYINNFFKKLFLNNAIALMDGATTRSMQYFYPNVIPNEPILVPISSSCERLNGKNISRKSYKEGEISIGYLGRMDLFKWSAIEPFIKSNLLPISTDYKVTLHIISEGGFVDDLKKLSSKHGIECKFYGYMPNEEAKNLLYEEVDFAIAMGTSALDLASIEIPTLIIDPSLKYPYQAQEKFHFVHEIKGYTLGEFRDFPHYDSSGISFSEAMTKTTMKLAGNLGAEYVCKKHNPEDSFLKLWESIKKSSLLVSDVSEEIQNIKKFSNMLKNPFFRMVKKILVKSYSYLRRNK